jgi:uncharacterized membrane protein YphA (DoxX/SURF4 family)
MKLIATIAGGLLGLAFVVFGLNHFFNFLPQPEGPPPSQEALSFMSALAPTGYLDFIKVLETLGGLLVALPKTRNLGLLVLGPIIVNILAFHIFLQKGATLVHPINIAVSALALFLLCCEHRAWSRLVTR